MVEPNKNNAEDSKQKVQIPPTSSTEEEKKATATTDGAGQANINADQVSQAAAAMNPGRVID